MRIGTRARTRAGFRGRFRFGTLLSGDRGQCLGIAGLYEGSSRKTQR